MRRHDWAARLFDVVTEHEVMPFQWGRTDCCMFVARALDAMLDTTYAGQLQNLYHDEESALDFISQHGGLPGAVSVFLGHPTDARAARGDVVLIDGGEGLAVGICMGGHLLAMGPTGLRILERSEIRAVWKV